MVDVDEDGEPDVEGEEEEIEASGLRGGGRKPRIFWEERVLGLRVQKGT